MYLRILGGFKEDQDALDQPHDWTAKIEELETKFKKDEQKKLAKPCRKDFDEWDDLFQGGPGLRTHEKGVKILSDRMLRFMKDSAAKSMLKLTKTNTARELQV